MNFGEKIKTLRNERNWTQDYVAKKLNISSPALSRYESGAYEPKDLALVSEFAKLYNVTTDYLLGISDEREPQSQNLYAFQGGYEQLTEANKKVLDGVLQTLLDNQKEE